MAHYCKGCPHTSHSQEAAVSMQWEGCSAPGCPAWQAVVRSPRGGWAGLGPQIHWQFYASGILKKINALQATWLAQSVECATLDLGVVSSSLTLDIEIT